MKECNFHYEGYELIIDSNCNGECEKLHYYARYEDVGSLITSFIDFVDKQEREKFNKILSYQQEVWEKQDKLEEYLRRLGYSFYTYTIPDSQEKCRYAVNPEYQEQFQKNRNSDFPKWAVVRIF